jgi:hypothetical protein
MSITKEGKKKKKSEAGALSVLFGGHVLRV